MDFESGAIKSSVKIEEKYKRANSSFRKNS